MANIPLNARQYLDLALQIPGVLPAAVGTTGGGINVGGARSQSNNFLLDGVSNTDNLFVTAVGNFRITDAVQEFAVQTSVAAAEFGRGAGAQVNIVTRSGTNQFHGTAFEYFRNSRLDAADFFTNRNRAAKNPLHRNQFGVTLGGPVLKNRLFFFGSWEAFRQVAPIVSSTRVPTSAERASVTDPISRALLRFWPDPNTSVPGSANNFIANVRATLFDNTGLGKLDYNLGENDRISARWTEYRGTLFTPGALPLLGGARNVGIAINVGFTHTHSFSPNVLNDFRFGFARNDGGTTVQDLGSMPPPSSPAPAGSRSPASCAPRRILGIPACPASAL